MSIWALLGLNGCQYFQSDQDSDAIAKVGNDYLMIENMAGVWHPSQSKADSLASVNQFISDWITNKLLMERAELNLPIEQLDIEERVAAYREQLMIYHFQQAYVEQKLDTVVTKSQIQDYYDRHEEDYLLHEDVYKMNLVMVNSQTPGVEKISEYMSQPDSSSFKALKANCVQFAMSCQLDSNYWFGVHQLVSELSMEKDFWQRQPKNKVVNLTLPQDRVAFFQIFDARKAQEPAPVAFVKEQIVRTILEKRKGQLLSQLEQELLDRALNSGYAEIY